MLVTPTTCDGSDDGDGGDAVMQTNGRGWGLRMKEAVPANTLIIEYMGKSQTVITA